ncbi:cyclophilin-like fold protein [Bacillus sp. FJAT-42376]|uniref:cyclophilin-like fold protein n=1 Tax=Bacillus sp. FJAT-42376 TaxID=2014076 RepID=UPI0019D2D190|nr:cyclophilin-like fold protein [Bacillus sp. FJAT-42376]
MMQDTRIKLEFNGHTVIVKMYDHPTSRDFIERLPLSLPFKDYANNEKISVLEEPLTVKDAPAGSKPSAGDLAYFSPWGNLALFYGDYDFSPGLILLGKMEEGGEHIKNMQDETIVRLEKMN